jgi:predicted lactoylglutathione lyase
MITDIFVNLMVKDLPKSIKFFEGLGFNFNKQFSDETAAALILGDHIYAMLLTENKMKQFTGNKTLIDSHSHIENILAVGVESKEAVDEMVDKAIELGAKAFRTPDDYGFMYSRSIEDLDGHVWEVLWMDPKHVE